MLDKDEVLHVAHLARIEITEEELEKYQKDLKILFDEIDKIKDLNDFDEDRMISPCNNSFDINDNMHEVDKDNLLTNVPKKKGNFVEVPVMVNE
jgi:aspartyl-tRNA(Asn)/glutamyl-tRNA(Gln) amidotransferase subunit C